MPLVRGEFSALHLNARKQNGQRVSLVSFRIAGKSREYQLEVRLPIEGNWWVDAADVSIPDIWGDPTAREAFVQEVRRYIMYGVGSFAGGRQTGSPIRPDWEWTYRFVMPFEVDVVPRI